MAAVSVKKGLLSLAVLLYGHDRITKTKPLLEEFPSLML